MTGVIIAAAIVGGTGIIIGLFLGISGEKLKVEVDEKEVAVREALPGNNCGGRGYPGCDGLSKEFTIMRHSYRRLQRARLRLTAALSALPKQKQKLPKLWVLKV